MKKNLLLTAILLFVAGCYEYGDKFNARTLEQTEVTQVLQKNRPRPIAISGAKTNVTFQAVELENRINPDWLKPPTQPFRLGPGDKVEIELISDPLSTRVVSTVGPDGKIYFYLLPGVDVWGLTLEETRMRLEEELKKFVRDRPQVGVTLRLVESKRVWLLGRFQAPGVYSMPIPMTLLEAISAARGTMNFTGTTDIAQLATSEELADLRRSFIVRKGQMLPVDFYALMKQGDLSQNIYLEPDDLIYLKPMTAREVYVMGAVQAPKAVPYHERMSLIDAISNAGGPGYSSYLSHVAIVRGSLTQPKIAIVDYDSIIHGNATDVILEAGDIVHVPMSPYRFIHRYFDLILNTFVSSVAINEGTRAVLDTRVTAPAGIFIPLGSKITVVPPTSGTPGPSQ